MVWGSQIWNKTQHPFPVQTKSFGMQVAQVGGDLPESHSWAVEFSIHNNHICISYRKIHNIIVYATLKTALLFTQNLGLNWAYRHCIIWEIEKFKRIDYVN